MSEIERLINGFRAFHKDYFTGDKTLFAQLKHGQQPKSMIIGCSDSRVDPAILVNSLPGDIFIVRNVANLVPPYQDDGGLHGVSAALEFAVCYLNIENIIVLGHSQCGGINALMTDKCCHEGNFISGWMSIAAEAREKVLAELPQADMELQQRAAEQASVIVSLDNLQSFPFVAERTSAGRLSLHGWYFDLHSGELRGYDAADGIFKTLVSVDW